MAFLFYINEEKLIQNAIIGYKPAKIWHNSPKLAHYLGGSMKITNFDDNWMIRHELGQRIKDVRVARNITQAELSKLSGVSLRTIGRLENGVGNNLDAFINVVRALNFAENLNLVICDQSMDPVIIYDAMKKYKRFRARKRNNESCLNWKWGDEE